MQQSRYGKTDITSEYLLYPFKSPIQYNVNYTGTFSKYAIIDKYYTNSLVKPVKRLYYGGAEWTTGSGPSSLTFSLTDLAYSFGDEILFKTASYPAVAADVSHPTFDRIDAIVIDEDGAIKIKKGIPSSDPKKPVIEEEELLIQYAKILKFSHPDKDRIGTNQVVYERSGSSWTPITYNISGDGSVSNIDPASSDNPYIFSTCFKASSDYRTGIDFRMPVGNIKRSDYASLSMRVRFDQEISKERYLSVSIYGTSSTGTASSNTINLMAYGLERDIVGEWQHIVFPTMKFGSKVDSIKGIKFRMIGGASSSIAYWSMDNILFQTGVDYDEYTDPSNCGPCVGSTTVSSGGGGGGGGGTFSLTVQDYLTGDSFSDIDKIIFRGNTVVVNTLPAPNGLTAIGVTVTQDIPKEVIVWIPAPNYVDFISPTIDESGTARYLSQPATASYTQSVAPGQFGTFSTSPTTDFLANGASVGTTRLTKNSASFNPFVETSPFSIANNTSTTIKFEVFREDGTTAVRTITKILNSANCGISHAIDDNGLSGATLTLGVLSSDQDKYKVASLTATLNLSTVFPNGGKLKCRLTHNNGTDGIFTFNTVDFFYDSDGSVSSASAAAPTFDERTPVLRNFSGIAYYGSGSTFALTASNINLLNDTTFPTTKQIDFTATNLAVSNSGVNFLNGHADGTKSGVGAAITGWGIEWNKSGLTFSRIATINDVMVNAGNLWTSGSTNFNDISGVYIPGFSPHTTNQLDSSKVSYVTVRLFDWGNPDYTYNSSTKKTLIDTDVPSSPSIISNPLDSEAFDASTGYGRISFENSFTQTLANSGFNSNIRLTAVPNLGELQYIFGRIIFPQHDFSNYMPYANFVSACNYSTCTGISKTFTTSVITQDGWSNGLSHPNALATLTLNDYRWFVTSYKKSDGTSFNGGTFRFECNWAESQLHCPTGTSGATGTEDLVIMVGFDSTSANQTPNIFMFLSGESGTWAGRENGPSKKLNGTGNSNEIQFSKNAVTVTTTRCWLYIGYKNSAAGKNLILSDILFTGA